LQLAVGQINSKSPGNYGKSPFLMGKSTINDSFSIAMLVYQRVSWFLTGGEKKTWLVKNTVAWLYSCTSMQIGARACLEWFK
jgi:hypothetical protein